MEERREHNIDNQRRSGKKRRKKGSKLIIVFAAIALLFGISLFIAVFGIKIATDVFGLNQENKEVDISVKDGMSVKEICALLEENEVIESSFVFDLYVRFRESGANLQAGDYVLNRNMSYDQIIAALRAGDVVYDEVRVTFYEGMSMREIAASLEENNVCDADDFIEYIEGTEFEYDFCELIPENDLRFRRMEGYLFPDTYDFYEGENVSSVAKKFLRTFKARVYDNLYEDILDAGMTLDEAITLASIIQEEASAEEQMGTVSSVFHNRMENPSAGLPMLQSDVTIFYVNDDIAPYQTMQTQDIYDAYNTYVCRGLPVGPICSPGVAAIKAAIYPEDTNYYFFVTDAEGKYYYSKYLEEHNRNVYIASKVGKAHGTATS